MGKITIIDAVMGSGKTYDAIQRMKKMQASGEKFVYVTPFLAEVDRVIAAVPEAKAPFSEYTALGLKKKRDTFLSMVLDGDNVVTTHALFATLLADDYDHFKDHVLILDEVVQPIELLDLSAEDMEILIHSHLMVIDEETGKASFSDYYTKGRFLDFKRLCDNGTVYLFNQYFLIWSFPPIIFSAFGSIQIMTYLFDGSILKTYFSIHDITYKTERGEEQESAVKERIRGLLTIYEGPANKVGYEETSFSLNWIKKRSSVQSKSIRTTASNILKRKFKTSFRLNAYTTFKAHKAKLGGSGYSKSFIPVNARGTNNFRDKQSMVYLANRYINPLITRYTIEHGEYIHQDNWALGELLQWLWRGCIRDNKPMNVYIPSSRMRGLLTDWLNN